MISNSETERHRDAVSVSGGFLWRRNAAAPEYGVSCSDVDPLEQEWARRLDPLSVRAAWCVGEARRVAGISGPSERPNREGVCVGTMWGAQQTRVRYASRLITHGLGGTNPIDFPDSIDGAPAAHVALRWNLQGPSFTFLGEDGAQSAIAIAARQIVLGTADRMHVVLGDVFEPRTRAVFTRSLTEQESSRAPDDGVLALVLEPWTQSTLAESRPMLVGFRTPLADESGKHSPRDQPCAAPMPGALAATSATAVVEAWLGLTAQMGSATIACQDASVLEGSRCYPLTSPQWPRLAFIRAEKR